MRWLLLPLASLSLFGCDAEQRFCYRGTVAAGGEAGSFDESANPEANPALSGVAIEMFALGDIVATDRSNAEGEFDTFEVDIRDGVKVPIRLTFVKAGYQTLEYSVDSETSMEPLRAEKQMNVVLQLE